jgi:hypothetical protein
MATTRNRKNPTASHLKAVAEAPQEVGSIPARQLRCRAGHHHFALDDWLPGEEEIPRGVTVMPASDGRLKLIEPCLDCLAVTGVTYTHPGGIFDGYLRRQIQYGPEWVRLGRVTTLVDDDEEAGRPSVAPALFRGA